jgi:acetoin utilization deacetylase AcuC-like enzyme
MSGLRCVYSERYRMDFLGHVFPTEKYPMIAEQLEEEGILDSKDIVEPIPPDPEDLALVHDPAYIRDLIELRWTRSTMFSELPLNRSIIEGFILAAGGTCETSRIALRDGIGYHVGGGFHHASRARAEGFCYVNDIAYALAKLKSKGEIGRAVVIDCDLHQGNGTARIFHDDSSVYTFSIHQEYNYPMPKARSDWDIGLPDGTGDEVYLSLLRPAVHRILDEKRPDLVIYQAGADPFVEDILGGLALTQKGLSDRDRIVLGAASERRIPVAVTLGGGYARNLEDLVDIHVETARVASDLLERGKTGSVAPDAGISI